MGALSQEVKDALTLLNAEDDGRTCKDIAESACRQETGNIARHVTGLALSKSADALINPKLVLSWVLSLVGAPVFFAGLLVPIRESGALLPQIFTAGYIRQLPRRKWVWAAGAGLQGGSALGIGLSVLLLEGVAAGISVVVLLTALALARSLCSVSYKDILGKTIAKERRGKVTGLAASLAATTAIILGLTVILAGLPALPLLAGAILVAGGAWLGAAFVMAGLNEHKGATEGGSNAAKIAIDSLSLLRDDKQLRLFIYTRGLLTVTALAPPFIAGLVFEGSDQLTSLGYLLLASAAATLVSSYVWGALADRSSRKVLIGSGALAALSLIIIVLNHWLTGGITALTIGMLFVLMLGYEGVRLGRSTHLVDMATEETRAAYTALSNSIIGILLIAGGLFAVLASYAGTLNVLGVMAALSVGAALMALRLEEVQSD